MRDKFSVSHAKAAQSELGREYEPYTASGEINSSVDGLSTTVEHIRAGFENQSSITMDELDGLSVMERTGAWWFNLRPSNLEELLRLNVEAKDEVTMRRVRDQVLEQIRVTG